MNLTTQVALFLALALGGCGGGGSAGAVSVDVKGAEGTPIAATNHLDVLVVEVGVGGAHAGVVVDTGSPVVALDPAAFGAATLPAGGGTVPALTVGALTFTRPYVVGADLVPSPDPTAPLAGSLGCGVLCAFAVALDYRASTVTLGAAAPPAGVESPGGAVAFSRRGGGSVTIDGVPGSVEFPPSRVTLAATVEGHAWTLVLDSGSSFVVLRQAARSKQRQSPPSASSTRANS